MLIKNAMIHDAINEKSWKGDIQIKDGKIAKIAKSVKPLKDEEIIDAEGLNAYPGFIDAHAHIGLDSFGGNTGGSNDYNEMNDIVSPQLRAIDSYNPLDAAIPNALEGGVTTVGTGPGSANVLGGTFVAVKLYGKNVEKSAVKKEVAMKCAFGENPKRCYNSKTNSTRMSTAARLRETLYQAKEYMLKKEAAKKDVTKMPPFSLKFEALIPVLKGEIPLKAHAHRADDILTALRIAKEFGVKITLEHCTEGHLIVEELAEANVPVAVGPTLGVSSKPELNNKSWTTPAILSNAGIQVSIITDSPVIPQEYLPLCAGLAVKAGMDPFKALQAITINPAKHLGIADRVGSLEKGKDADIVLIDGDPLHSCSNVKKVIVDGKVLVDK